MAATGENRWPPVGRTGWPLTQGGAEFAEEIIEPMDFYQAGRSDPTIQDFTDDLRAALRRLA